MITLIQPPTPMARPTGLGSQCEEYVRNPLILDELLPETPLLVRCKGQATRRLTLKNGDDVYAIKFCDRHHRRLQEQIEAGKSLVEILDDREMETRR